MGNYEALWTYIRESGKQPLVLSFEEIETLLGVPLNHAFLNRKKELLAYGWEVQKIYMKEKTVRFVRKNTAEI